MIAIPLSRCIQWLPLLLLLAPLLPPSQQQLSPLQLPSQRLQLLLRKGPLAAAAAAGATVTTWAVSASTAACNAVQIRSNGAL